MNDFIICFDIETTGLNPKEDFIIQLAALKFRKDNNEFIAKKSWYIKPAHAYTISPQAEAVHGLSKEFIDKNGVYFKDIADEFISLIKDADYLTYNGNSFDVKFLYEEFKRWDIEMPIDGKKFYDAFSMECRFAPRDLGSVYKKYTGEVFEDAHDAYKDCEATITVFLNQMKHYNLSYNDINEFDENTLLTPDGSIRNAAKPGDPKRLVFAIGKYKDSEFMDVYKKDPGYTKWFFENVASKYTLNLLREYYKENR